MSSSNESLTVLRSFRAGLAGGVVWVGAMLLFFGPAQAILANPTYQSKKFLQVLGGMEPLPRASGNLWVLPVGFILLGTIYGVVYHVVRPAFSGRSWWGKGLRFGGVSWALMAPWFEFFLPWNVLHEPALLVLLELVLWFCVLSCVGVAIAGVYESGIDEVT